jgi:hypothetical protein
MSDFIAKLRATVARGRAGIVTRSQPISGAAPLGDIPHALLHPSGLIEPDVSMQRLRRQEHAAWR